MNLIKFMRGLSFAFLFLVSSISFAEKVDVVIMGAGLSGLATAYHLKKAGLSYKILEISPYIGGRVRTVKYQFPGEPETFTDSGMEEYWESNPAVQVLKELKLPLSHDFAASSLVLNKKLEALGDEEPKEFLQRIFSPTEYQALEGFKKKVEPDIKNILSDHRAGKRISKDLLKLKDISFANFVMKQHLPPKVREWIRVSVECETGTTWDRFSALDGLAEFHIFLGNGEESYRVTGGNQKFTEAFAKAVGTGNISLNRKVTRVVSDPMGKNVKVYYLDTDTHTHHVIEAQHFVSTAPLYRILIDLQFEPALSVAKQKAIQSQQWGSYFKVHAFFPMEAEKFWSKNGASTLPILSDSELGVIYDGNRDQEAKTKVVSLLVSGPLAEKFNLMPLDYVRPTILKGFERLWPGSAKMVKGMEFYRIHPRAIAAWPVGRSRYDDLSHEIRIPENRVYLAGDFTESSHSDGAFLSAERVVNQILAAEGKKQIQFAKRK